MTHFGGPAFCIDRDNINTDEIIPAKYLTEISKAALQPHLLEDLLIDGKKFDNTAPELQQASVLISRKNFGCGSSREHAVWVLEVNQISVVIAESFARIFRQNMFNCGIMAIELETAAIAEIMAQPGPLTAQVDLARSLVEISSQNAGGSVAPVGSFPFKLNEFDRELISAGGWLAYADSRY
ncbi:MAG: 3-isopropylmalate dehydratase small subunit [Desulfofustis sp.]|nr:3-isopropylmalate dehydratase small subunit [Desulfofustis sp.]